MTISTITFKKPVSRGYGGPNDDWDIIASEFFNSKTPDDVEYWSMNYLEYNKKANREINAFFKNPNTTWEDILDKYYERLGEYCKHWGKFNPEGTGGNGKPTQHNCYDSYFTFPAVDKLFAKYGIKDEYEQSIGYGYTVWRCIALDFHCFINENGKAVLKCSCRVKGDDGFHDELKEIAEQMKADIKAYKKNSKVFKTKFVI